MPKAVSVTKKIGKTFKQYGRVTIPQKMLKHSKRREVTVVLEDMRYVFEADKYGRIYLPPEIRQRVEDMQVIEVATSDGNVLVKFKRF
ncbi:MAG TPA: hypothetical protein EYH45_02105 [Candidatus Caldiarchaeum subterraneum]|uniref:Uncharacterized protein n=1 Tax=Caldiarchaeum subterraneum TaxID=311458 RepID=A0A832ZVE8_CALS0|nr:hypothetical protein [Aigarchaeota archaeon]HIQ29338.1 hypothetical protein [Candidatus Caldarchaeum subterraneum]